MARRDIEAGRAVLRLMFKDDMTRKLTRSLRKAGNAMKSLGSTMNRAGIRIAAAGVAMTAPFVVALRIFANFDDKMRQVKAVTGAVGAEFESLREKAKELGRTTAFTASQVAEGMVSLGQMGFTTNEILKGIPAVLALAAAGAVELADASRIAAKTAGGFKLPATELARVADAIAVAASGSGTDVIMMGEAFSKVAPIAQAAGQTLEETATAIGLMADASIDSSVAGVSMKNILVSIAEKTSILGVSTRDANGEMRPMLDIMRELGEKTNDMKGPEKLVFFMKEFDKRSAAAAITLAVAGDKIEILRDKMDNASGAAEKMAATMEGGFGGSIRKLLSSVEGLAIEIGEALAPTMKAIVDIIAPITVGISKWVMKNRKLVIVFGVVALATIAAGVALVGLGAIAVAVGSVITGMISIVTGAVAVFGAVSAVVTFLLSPIGLVIAAIAALGIGMAAQVVIVAAVIAAWLRWTKSGQAAAEIIKKTFGKLLEFGKKIFGGLKNALVAGDMKQAAEVLMAAWEVAFSIGKIKMLQVWLEYKDSMLDIFDSLFSILRRQFNQFTKSIAAPTLFLVAKMRGTSFKDSFKEFIQQDNSVEEDRIRRSGRRRQGSADQIRNLREGHKQRQARFDDAIKDKSPKDEDKEKDPKAGPTSDKKKTAAGIFDIDFDDSIFDADLNLVRGGKGTKNDDDIFDIDFDEKRAQKPLSISGNNAGALLTSSAAAAIAGGRGAGISVAMTPEVKATNENTKVAKESQKRLGHVVDRLDINNAILTKMNENDIYN